MSRAKRKKKRERAKKHQRRMSSSGGGGRFGGTSRAGVGRAPLRDVFISPTIFEQGIGSVVISRDLPAGAIGVGVFLLDVYCLGVKNAFFSIRPGIFQYEDFIEMIRYNQDLEPAEPARGRKLVEDAVEYARGLGFEPQRDYREAAMVLGDIDPSLCREEFTFGQDGKPVYISGPRDSQAMIGRVLATLRQRCGEDGFHYSVPSPPLNGI